MLTAGLPSAARQAELSKLTKALSDGAVEKLEAMKPRRPSATALLNVQAEAAAAAEKGGKPGRGAAGAKPAAAGKPVAGAKPASAAGKAAAGKAAPAPAGKKAAR